MNRKKKGKDYTNTMIGVLLFILFFPTTMLFVGSPIISNIVFIFFSDIKRISSPWSASEYEERLVS